ncbi:MAG: nickel-dependent hydrogenase large subunit [Candidatus Bipolaricaulota bacterium]
MKRVNIDPVTRVEGHLSIEVEIEGNLIRSARSSGTLFRGLEEMLNGRDPRDASRITQRVCGVCPAAHAVASALALDDAFDIRSQIPLNGRILRNLMLGGNFIQSHILHFYHLSALDYIDPKLLEDKAKDNTQLGSLQNYLDTTDGAPFLPQYSGDYRLGEELTSAFLQDYLDALEIRKKAHELISIFGGKMPHNMGTVVGGATNPPDLNMITKFRSRLDEIREFIDNRYLPGVIELGQAYSDYFDIGHGVDSFVGYGGFYLDNIEDEPQVTKKGLCGGVTSLGNKSVDEIDLEKITEYVTHSWYSDRSTGHPRSAKTVPAVDKEGGYSWVKAPRYDDRPQEVGPTARMMVNYSKANERLKPTLEKALESTGTNVNNLPSVAGRHLARATECKVVADLMSDWVNQLEPSVPTCAQFDVPEEGLGVGLTCAPRGALGHWIRLQEGEIQNYQLVVPTTWNASPRDEEGIPGPIEQALIGTRIEDSNNPIEAARIVRSFDPCMACAVH